MRKNIFVIPNNTPEEKTIIELLENNGYKEGQNLFVTNQPNGATWKGFSQEDRDALNKLYDESASQATSSRAEFPRIYSINISGSPGKTGAFAQNWADLSSEERKSALEKVARKAHVRPTLKQKKEARQYRRYTPEMVFVLPNDDLESRAIFEFLKEHGFKKDEDVFVTYQTENISWENIETELKDKLRQLRFTRAQIYGVELQGQNEYGAEDIDHHIYAEEDRSNPKASLEQVSDIIGVKLYYLLPYIAANDKGGIPAMERLAAEQGVSGIKKIGYIQKVRMWDRAAQGITPDENMDSLDAIKDKQVQENGLCIISILHNKCNSVTDWIYHQYENILILCGDGEINFFGHKEICKQLQIKFHGEVGENFDALKFWRGNADPQEVKAVIDQQLINTYRQPHGLV